MDAEAELKSYETAHNLFKAGKYKESAEAFEKFLDVYPGSKYAPSAQYWIGYAHFSRKDYKAAIASQQKLIKAYPDNHKVPDAMYNIANSQIQLADIDGAKQTLRALIEKFPLSDAAPLAKKRLAVLESVKSKKLIRCATPNCCASTRFSIPCKGKPPVSGCPRYSCA